MTSAVLLRSPEEGARLLALGFLDQAAEASSRLAGDGDPEALHDFRVGLRQLRSALRSYREAFAGSLSKKLARRLRRLAAATGEGRDTEVQIEWLRSVTPSRLVPHLRMGWRWLLARLEARKEAAYARLLQEIEKEFPSLAAGLRQELSVYRAEVHLDASLPPPSLGEVTAEIARRQWEELADRLGEVAGAEDETAAHRARIEAKRLRYLLEPFADAPKIRRTVKQLKELQDLLGELHDAHVLERELADALGAAAAERAEKLLALSLEEPSDPARLRAERRRSPEPGLLRIARLNRERRDERFATLADDWLGDRTARFRDEAAAALAGLTAAADEE